MPTHLAPDQRIRLGISTCLLGQAVRYDGGDKYDAYINETLGRYFEFVPFCPEVAIGMGVPRPPIQLVRTTAGVRARGVADPSMDVTERLTGYAAGVAPTLGDVSGYIFKKNSPSCGMKGVQVYRAGGRPAASGIGLYARILMQQWPALPVEEEDGLLDPVRRENFLERVLVYHRWRQMIERPLTAAALREFHERHRLILLAHDDNGYRTLRRTIAGKAPPAFAPRYLQRLMQVLRKPVTRSRHARVLRYLVELLEEDPPAASVRGYLALVGKYRRGLVPRSVPIAEFQRLLRQFPSSALRTQYYLCLRPDEQDVAA